MSECVNFIAMKPKIILNWSGGKDSALCLYKILQEDQYEVSTLLTSISKKYQRISMHGVRVELLKLQAKSIGLPVQLMEMEDTPTMHAYEESMRLVMEQLKNEGVEYSIFGDIFLEDLRLYRETQLQKIGMKALFPLWKKSTTSILNEFLDLGFKTIITCVNDQYLDKNFAGKIIDKHFINDLPSNVDACGENGEFHTFVFDGPIFKDPVLFDIGETVYKKYNQPASDTTADSCNANNPFNSGFWYCDLLPK